MTSTPWRGQKFGTQDDQLEHAVSLYWRRRFPLMVGRFIAIDRTPAPTTVRAA